MTFTPTIPSAFASSKKGAHDNVIGNDNTDDDTIQKQKCQQFSDAFNAALDLDCPILNNSQQQQGETPPPIEIEGCEGCFIDAVSGDPTNAQKLLLKLNSDAGIAITIGSRVQIVHSLVELCLFLDTAITRGQVDSAINQVITQAGLQLTAEQTATLEQCVADEVGVRP
jgi:hypothetical protein